MKILVVSGSPLIWNGKRLEPGTEFRANQAQARMLIATGRAREPLPAPPRRSYRRRDMIAERPASQESDE